MRRTATMVAAVVLTAIADMSAHRLDEYLQATRIAVMADRVALEIGLTPGIAVAPRILTSIDRDGDGRLSASEVDAYARVVLQDVAVSVDGRARPFDVVRAESSPIDELRAGTGTIRIDTSVAVSPLSPGRHLVRVVNTHASDIGVYLVNALAPSDPAIAIAGQRRDVLQHGVDLDVEIFARAGCWVLGAACERSRSIVWGVVMFGGVAALAIARVVGSWRQR